MKGKKSTAEPLPAFFFSQYSVDKAKREAIIWRTLPGAVCHKCGGRSMTGFLDGQPVALACTTCGASCGCVHIIEEC